MKKTNKIITILMLVAILSMSLFISTVYADETTPATVTSPGTVTVTRNITGVTNNVTNTFTYTITQDTTSPYVADAVTGAPSSATIAFSNASPTSGAVTANTTVDFSSAQFKKVGDYRFILTETNSTNATQYPLDSSTYYLYVSVRYDANDTDGTNKVATVNGTAMKNSTATPTSATKVPVVFTSESIFTNITITKTVTGNMGDKAKYFDISVNIPGSGTYLVSGGKYGTAANSTTSVTAGTATTLQIKHGETLTIGLASDGSTNQIPVGAQYTVGETAVEGYTTTIDGASTNPATKTTVEAAASNVVEIVNNYDAATLTGVFLNIMPYVVIAAAVVILIALMVRSRKSKREE